MRSPGAWRTLRKMTSQQVGTPVEDAAKDSPALRREVLAQVDEALDRGLVSTRDVQRFLERAAAQRRPGERPTAALVLYAVGAVVVFGGLALAYYTIFHNLPRGLRVTTPFLFPLTALAACLTLQRRRLAAWQVELAGLVSYVAFAGACVTVSADSGWASTTLALYTAACASVAAALAIGLFAAIRNVRLLVLGLGAALAVLGLSLAYLIGLRGEHTIGWVLLAEAAAAAGAAYLLAARNRPACEYAACWTMVGVWASSITGVSAAGGNHFTIWHITLAVGVVCAFLLAGATRPPSSSTASTSSSTGSRGSEIRGRPAVHESLRPAQRPAELQEEERPPRAAVRTNSSVRPGAGLAALRRGQVLLRCTLPLVRPPAATRSHAPPGPASARQPARWHPPRLPPPPHDLRRNDRLGSHPHAIHLTATPVGCLDDEECAAIRCRRPRRRRRPLIRCGSSCFRRGLRVSTGECGHRPCGSRQSVGATRRTRGRRTTSSSACMRSMIPPRASKSRCARRAIFGDWPLS